MRKRIVILGAGGHAKEICVTLQLNGYQVVGFLDDDPALWGTQVLGLGVLGPISHAPSLDIEGAIVGIGDNEIRRAFFEQLERWGIPIVNAIHPSAIISPHVFLGKGVVVHPQAIINVSAQIGDNVIINSGAIVTHDVTVGDHAHIGPGACLCGGVKVGKLAFVGAGAAVIPGKSIGEGAVIGAGGTVVEDIPPHSLAVGVPARTIKKLSKESLRTP